MRSINASWWVTSKKVPRGHVNVNAHVDVDEGSIGRGFLLAPRARRAPRRPASAPPSVAPRSAGAHAKLEDGLQDRGAAQAVALLPRRREPVRPGLLEVRHLPPEG